MRDLIVLVIVFSSSLLLGSDSSIDKRVQFYLSSSLGYYHQFNSIYDSRITSSLIDNSERIIQGRLSFGVSPIKNYGINLDLTLGLGKPPIYSDFNGMIQERFGNEYYVVSTNDYRNPLSNTEGIVHSKLISLTFYRSFSTRKFKINPYFGVGLYSFETNFGSSILKSKNSNEVLSISYRFLDNVRQTKDFLTLVTGIKLVFPIKKSWNLFLEPQFNLTFIDYFYVESINNSLLGKEAINNYPYKTELMSIMGSIGVLLNLNEIN